VVEALLEANTLFAAQRDPRASQAHLQLGQRALDSSTVVVDRLNDGSRDLRAC
jgi:hypothetical protein